MKESTCSPAITFICPYCKHKDYHDDILRSAIGMIGMDRNEQQVICNNCEKSLIAFTGASNKEEYN